MTEEQAYNSRAIKVLELIQNDFGGVKAAFTREWNLRLRSLGLLDDDKEISASIVNRWFWEENSRNIGAKHARKIEIAFGLPRASLDSLSTDENKIHETPALYVGMSKDMQEVLNSMKLMSKEDQKTLVNLAKKLKPK